MKRGDHPGASPRPRVSLKARALKILAQREHSRTELRRKLLPHALLACAAEAEAHARAAAQHPAAEAASGGSADHEIAALDANLQTARANTREAAFEKARGNAHEIVTQDSDISDIARAQAGPCLDKLLDWLEGHGLLSETRFVESRLRTRASRFGNLRIRQELAQHGVEIPLAAKQQLEATEVERARQVWLRKFGEPAPDAASRARQMRFLSARGFSPHAVRLAVAADFGDRVPLEFDEPATEEETGDADD